jgi:DNA-directed RNA polymerase subunit RPC12/RpoP
MEKYAVEISDDMVKVAEKGKAGKCPDCGNTLPQNTTIPYCTYCGTKPFEKK